MKISNNKIFLNIAFFCVLTLKMFSQGPSYFPVLDDYIQYGGYPLYDSLSHVYFEIGTIATRPFASILDPLLWGSFYPNLWIPSAIITILFFIGAFQLSRGFDRLGIFITPYLYAILLLFPLGFEGTYWLSAASRICVGLFFCGIAFNLLIKYIGRRNKKLFLPYLLTTILSFGFYESVMVVSALLQFFVVISLVKNKRKWPKFLLTPVICGIAMLVYYLLASNIGALGSRASGFVVSGFFDKLPSFFTQLYEVLVLGSIKTTLFGFVEGIVYLLSDTFGKIFLATLATLSVFCGYLGGKARFNAPAKRCIPLGLCLTFLPLLPNLFAGEVWITYRSIVPCFIGLTIVSAPIFSKILIKKNVSSFIIFLMVFIFSVANVNELITYKQVSAQDENLVADIAMRLDDDVLSGNKNAIVVLDEEVVVPQVSYYKDHVKSVFDSDWALTGAIRAKCENVKIKMVTPVYSLDGIDTSDKQIIYVGGKNE